MCHALVIEDEFLIAEHIAALAEDADATSIDFANCEVGAISMAHNRKPDIILSDVKLRTGTGPAAVQAILEEWGELQREVRPVTRDPAGRKASIGNLGLSAGKRYCGHSRDPQSNRIHTNARSPR